MNLLPAERAQARRATPSPSGCARSSDRIADAYGARIKVAEVPPGPPVLQTLVAEVYGPISRPDRRWRGRSSRSLQQTRRAWWTWTGTRRIRSRKLAMHVDEAKGGAARHPRAEWRRRWRWHVRACRPGCCTCPKRGGRADPPCDSREPTAHRDSAGRPSDCTRRTAAWCRCGELVARRARDHGARHLPQEPQAAWSTSPATWPEREESPVYAILKHESGARPV